MSDLAQLMQMAPFAGAYQTLANSNSEISNRDTETARLSELINELKIKNAQSSAINPLMLEHQRLQNQGLEAEIPGKRANSDKLGYEATQKKATLQSDTDAAIAGNQTKITEDQAKQVRARAQTIYSIGQQASQEGPTGAAKAQQWLKEAGVPDGAPQYGWSPQQMMQYGEAMIKHSEAYLQHLDANRDTNRSHEKVAGIQVQGQKDIEQMRIDAGKYNRNSAKDFEQIYQKLPKNSLKYAALLDEATKARQGGENGKSAEYLQRAAEIKPLVDAELNAANTAKPDIAAATKDRIPRVAPPDITPPSQRDAAPAGPAGSTATIIGALQKAGMPYEPAKYMYMVDPKTGKVFRKPKGG